MESALDVLSRAATMVQDNANETRLTSKELPTTAWRRERRMRAGEYHHLQQHPSSGSSSRSMHTSSPSSSPPPTAHVQHSSISSGTVSNTNTNMRSTAHHLSIMMAAAASMRPLSESINHPPTPPHSNMAAQINFGQIPHSQVLQQINSIQNDDGPLDMSVGSLKQRNSPPPPYREPLPGSQFASSLARPSVITQAPPKRDARDPILTTNRENDNRSCESIDEHFRRSLGNDYFSLFSKRSPAMQLTKTPSPLPHEQQLPISYIKSSSPTSPLLPGTPALPPQSTLMQSELLPPPAYPGNFCADQHQQNSQQAHQKQAHATPNANNSVLSPVTIAAQRKISAASNSPPLPLVVRANMQQNHQHTRILHRSSSLMGSSPLTSPQPTAPTTPTTGVKLSKSTQNPIFNTSGSRTASPLPMQQPPSAATATLSHLASLENSPSLSPRHTPPAHNVPIQNPSPNLLPAMMRIKTEPGLQNLKSNNPTPPASPTSSKNQNINSNSTSNSSNISSPPSPQTTSWKASTNLSNTSAEVLASVDDHFAKALGDTWKKLQESKEMRK